MQRPYFEGWEEINVQAKDKERFIIDDRHISDILLAKPENTLNHQQNVDFKECVQTLESEIFLAEEILKAKKMELGAIKNQQLIFTKDQNSIKERINVIKEIMQNKERRVEPKLASIDVQLFQRLKLLKGIPEISPFVWDNIRKDWERIRKVELPKYYEELDKEEQQEVAKYYQENSFEWDSDLEDMIPCNSECQTSLVDEKDEKDKKDSEESEVEEDEFLISDEKYMQWQPIHILKGKHKPGY